MALSDIKSTPRQAGLATGISAVKLGKLQKNKSYPIFLYKSNSSIDCIP